MNTDKKKLFFMGSGGHDRGQGESQGVKKDHSPQRTQRAQRKTEKAQRGKEKTQSGKRWGVTAGARFGVGRGLCGPSTMRFRLSKPSLEPSLCLSLETLCPLWSFSVLFVSFVVNPFSTYRFPPASCGRAGNLMTAMDTDKTNSNF
ncbi:MAG: hypothetical protein Q8O00_13115 [Holophaga sp.]|nr:hypothetical protein [Holophaga sp.]